ncbi:MAG: hypothetical protein FJY92_01095 [Candidatus Hydrogenedentes bacterium]|nr:hypothetical protein [Candidatus Hydrogenedentota bacterium]
MKRMGMLVALLAAVGMVQFGCGKEASETTAEKAVESAMKASGQEADVTIKDNAMTVTTKDGSSSFGEGAKVPDNWPSDVPIYDGLKILAAVAAPQAFTVTGTTGDSLDKLTAYYKEQATKNGWAEDSVMSQPPLTMLSYRKEGEKRNLAIVISTEGGQQSVSITVGNE